MGLRDIAQTSELIRRGEISPVEVLRDCLQTIERLNPSLNAFITITAHSAQNEAAQAEAEISAGRWRGPLHGIPIGLKDLIDTAGVRTTAASGVYENRLKTLQWSESCVPQAQCSLASKICTNSPMVAVRSSATSGRCTIL